MLQRWRITITGIVQGVGFRPHVARVAARFSGAYSVKGHSSSASSAERHKSSVSSAEEDMPIARDAGTAKLTGFVGNNDAQVFIEAQAEPQILEDFLTNVRDPRHLPPLARIDHVQVTQIDTEVQEREFRIVASQRLAGARTLIPPDVATCPECLADMADPANRRYGYAFTTCTNCGPRLSIIEDVPYDRPLTTMRDFPMCPECASEYADPLDRRYHAQPISCYACGPHLWIVRSEEVTAALGDTALGDAKLGETGVADPFAESAIPAKLIDGSLGQRDKKSQDAALRVAREALHAGKILALKGIGGFHLMVDASNREAVERLRARKHRDGKPFAVMVRNLDQAREIVECGKLGSADQRAVTELLASIERPILVLPRVHTASLAEHDSGAHLSHGAGRDNEPDNGHDRRNARAFVSDAAAPRLSTLGVMLAYSPLHQLLLEGLDMPVIATSGNLSNEPLCYTNEQALTRLAGIADVFLLHNRDIAVPVEDSVIHVDTSQIHPDAGALPTPIRRSRGYAPVPIRLALPTPAQLSAPGRLPVILGVGGELKNTLTLVRDGLAFMSAHIGDMGSLESQQAYEAAMRQMLAMHREMPSVIVHDAHPNYATTAWAQRYASQQEQAGFSVTRLPLQHHRAHALALLAEYCAARGGEGGGELSAGWKPEASGKASAGGSIEKGALLSKPVIIAALDGTGYGDDGAIWGSEIFCVNIEELANIQGLANMERLAQGGNSEAAILRLWHLPYFPLLGGDKAVREPWRLALALCHEYGIDPRGLGCAEYLSTPAGTMLAAQLQRLHPHGDTRVHEGNVRDGVLVDSVGRYFDAVSAMLGLCSIASYEAQAAVALQEAAEEYHSAPSPAATLSPAATPSPAQLLTSIAQAYKACPTRETAQRCAYLFHDGLARIIAEKLCSYAKQYGSDTVGVTGGSAVNSLLTGLIDEYCSTRGLRVLLHRTIPPNDGGLSLGQAYYGLLWASI